VEKRLVITEKPSVARDVAAALGGFEDHGEWLESDDYVVTFAVGHLLELAEPQDYDPKWRSWSIQNLPILPDAFEFKPRDGQKKRLDLIKKLGTRKDVGSVVNACDAGREGELIYRRIVEYTGLDQKPSERLWLQSMTPDAIRDGFRTLRPGHDLDRLADAAWLRAVGDWLVGMNATRALTQRLKSRGEMGAWSAGRVQTPTLALLVAREREILAHVPVPYWELEGKFTGAGHSWTGTLYDPSLGSEEDEHRKPTRLFDEARARALLDGARAKGAGQASETRKKSTQKPPLPFDLTTLQREANRRFSYSAKRTLETAQRLYEGYKLLTYPRTDSRNLPDDYGPTIDNILGFLSNEADLGSVAARVVKDGPQNLDKVLDSTKVSDHFAIVPTGQGSTADLSDNDRKIWDLVVRQFLASLMGPATWATVERFVDVETPAGVARFRTTARTLEIPGFQEALGKETGSGSDLPALVPGRDQSSGVAAAVDDVEIHASETKARPRYSEAMLLRSMETAGEMVDEGELSEAMKERGLGTPATRAETIEGLVSKGYARRVDNRMAPTSKAMRLMDVIERLKVPALASVRLTGEWEHALRQVQHGELDRAELLARLRGFTEQITVTLKTLEHDRLYAGDPSLGACPSCGEGQVIESTWGYPCSRNTGRESVCNFMIWKDRAGRYMDRGTVARLVAERKIGPVDGFVDRSGRSLSGFMSLRKDDDAGKWVVDVEYGAPSASGDVVPVEEVEGEELCPSPTDPDDVIVETNLRYVSRKLLRKEAKSGPMLPRVVCQREISPDEARPFFGEAAETALFADFISKRGRPFTGKLVRKPTGKHGFEFPPREGRPGRVGKATTDEAPKRGRKAKSTEDVGEDVADAPKAKKSAAKKAASPRARKAAPTTETADAAPKAKKAAASTVEAAGSPPKAKKAAAKKAPSKAKKAAPPPPPEPKKVVSKKAGKKKGKGAISKALKRQLAEG
jgi:DNA topoisomerase-3